MRKFLTPVLLSTCLLFGCSTEPKVEKLDVTVSLIEDMGFVKENLNLAVNDWWDFGTLGIYSKESEDESIKETATVSLVPLDNKEFVQSNPIYTSFSEEYQEKCGDLLYSVIDDATTEINGNDWSIVSNYITFTNHIEQEIPDFNVNVISAYRETPEGYIYVTYSHSSNDMYDSFMPDIMDTEYMRNLTSDELAELNKTSILYNSTEEDLRNNLVKFLEQLEVSI